MLQQGIMLKQTWKKIIQFGFRLLYNELAWTYDMVSWMVSLGSWREWQRAAIPFVKGSNILEVGHGPGHMLAYLSNSGHRVYGLDLSPYMGRIAQKRVSVPLVQGKVQELPFSAAAFDTALSTFPTEYIAQQETLAAIYRVLRPGGRFVVVPEGHLTGTTLLHHFIEWLFHITGQRQGPFAIDETLQWPKKDQWQMLQKQFEIVGFEVEVKRVQLDRSAVSIVIAIKT